MNMRITDAIVREADNANLYVINIGICENPNGVFAHYCLRKIYEVDRTARESGYSEAEDYYKFFDSDVLHAVTHYCMSDKSALIAYGKIAHEAVKLLSKAEEYDLDLRREW